MGLLIFFSWICIFFSFLLYICIVCPCGMKIFVRTDAGTVVLISDNYLVPQEPANYFRKDIWRCLCRGYLKKHYEGIFSRSNYPLNFNLMFVTIWFENRASVKGNINYRLCEGYCTLETVTVMCISRLRTNWSFSHIKRMFYLDI